ncbi:TrkH family potassium uptake protein [Oceanobacillus jeddahense]|uniref:TrkH family potassium uptake protein n=1 Tax=Oceanobacillus jeddahense TaxID=1462527 RepID=A0ABY5JN30_9BACI|nr:TrkH family potassium uptake protein [Oceanobacillus jeddahense]UUI01694.1 TrkH family potassium uptake protein [Oceanobacillus jeddahense]
MKKTHNKYKSIRKWNPFQLLLFYYIAAIALSTGLLSLPVSHQPEIDIPFIDIIFTAVSAISVTGLSTISIADSLSTTGIVFLALMMQIGAVGIMALGTILWVMLGKRIGFKERSMIMTDQNQTHFDGMVRLIKNIVYLLLMIEAIFFVILAIYFMQYYSSFGEAFLHGFFTVISALTNGGFDITGQSMLPFHSDYFVQAICMLLIIIGAIGYPVIIEVKEYIFHRRKLKHQFHFSLFTKLTTTTFFSLIFVGTVGIYLFDFNGFFKGVSWHESLFYALFQSITTRSGGLATMDLNLLSDTNHLFMSVLMFIGASPSSAGGGIRTTTFALVLIFLITFIRGGRDVKIFHREVYEVDLNKAVTVTFFAIMAVFTSVIILTLLEPVSLDAAIFEVTSAFGTVGLSLGITGELSVFSKIILMILMFIGRVGILSFLLIFRRKKDPAKFNYPKERMIIG